MSLKRPRCRSKALLILGCACLTIGCTHLSCDVLKTIPPALKDLPPVNVIVEPLNAESASVLGNRHEELERTVKEQLSQAGIQVIETSGWKLDQRLGNPQLSIQYATHQIGPSLYTYYVQLVLSQPVIFTTDRETKVVLTTPYSRHGPIAVNDRISPGVIGDAIKPLLDKFISDYKRANDLI